MVYNRYCYILHVRMSDESDAKQILTASRLENWRRPPGHPRTTWMKTTQQDLESLNLSLNEAIDMAQNCPLWRMMSPTFGAVHSYRVTTHLENLEKSGNSRVVRENSDKMEKVRGSEIRCAFFKL